MDPLAIQQAAQLQAENWLYFNHLVGVNCLSARRQLSWPVGDEGNLLTFRCREWRVDVRFEG